MEKLRRDRINSSLNEMKILVLESLNKDVSTERIVNLTDKYWRGRDRKLLDNETRI